MTTYALAVRDAILARLQAKPFFSGFARFAKTKALQVWTEHIPFCGCYFLSESLTPDGDDNAGEPRFRSMARYGFSVIVRNNDPDLAEAQLDLAFVQITDLLTDPSLYLNPAAKIQAYAAGDRSHSYGNGGLNNETPIAELRFDLSVDLGTVVWEPPTPDDLRIIHVEVPYAKVGDPVEIVAQYSFIAPVDLVVSSPDLGQPAVTSP